MTGETLNAVANWVLLSGFPAIVLFVLLYNRSEWRSTPVGRSLMYQGLAMCLVVTIVLLSLFFQDYPGRPLVRILGYAAFSVTLWRMVFTVVAYQRTRDHEEAQMINAFRRRRRRKTTD